MQALAREVEQHGVIGAGTAWVAIHRARAAFGDAPEFAGLQRTLEQTRTRIIASVVAAESGIDLHGWERTRSGR